MATDTPPLVIFAIVLGIFVGGLVTFWTVQHFKAKKAAKEKERQKEKESIPMTAVVSEANAVKPEDQPTSAAPVIGSKPNNDSHSELCNAIGLEENRRSVYDSEFYVSTDRDPFARKTEL